MDQRDRLIAALTQQRNAAADECARLVVEANMKIAELEARIKELEKPNADENLP
jgi:hypothetical protein